MESFAFRLDGGSNFRVNINEETDLPMNDVCNLEISCGGAHVEDHFSESYYISLTVIVRAVVYGMVCFFLAPFYSNF